MWAIFKRITYFIIMHCIHRGICLSNSLCVIMMVGEGKEFVPDFVNVCVRIICFTGMCSWFIIYPGHIVQIK